jgi:hypothetical protein
MEKYHGRAVRLFPDNPRTPFHGAFIDQEMRTRGRYPYQPDFADRPIELPIPWQIWMTDTPGGDTDRNHQSNAHSSSLLLGRPQLVGHQHIPNSISMPPNQDATTGPAGNLHESKKPTTITFTNPITNPSELEAVMRSARQEPNWKAAVIEGQSWEGTAEENIAKYRRVMPPPDTA